MNIDKAYILVISFVLLFSLCGYFGYQNYENYQKEKAENKMLREQLSQEKEESKILKEQVTKQSVENDKFEKNIKCHQAGVHNNWREFKDTIPKLFYSPKLKTCLVKFSPKLSENEEGFFLAFLEAFTGEVIFSKSCEKKQGKCFNEALDEIEKYY